MVSGWIKLHRKMVEWEWYSDIPCKVLFIHLLIVANHKPSSWKGMTIDRGQRVTGRSALAAETGLSEQEIRTAIGKLKSTNNITIKTTNKFSIITICNYEEYQSRDIEDQPASQPASQPTSNQQSTTNKNIKKERRKEHSSLSQERFDLFWEKYPRKAGKKDAFKAWEKQKCFNGHFELIMERVEVFNSSCSGKDQQFIPLPSTWINGERWNDEIIDSKGNEKIGGLTF